MRPGIRAYVIALVSTMVLVAGLGSVAAQSQDEVDEARRRREAAQQRVSEAKAAEAFVENDLYAALASYEDVTTELEQAVFRSAQLRDRVTDYEADLRGLRREARDLAVEAYMTGDTNMLFFEAGTFNELVTGQEVLDQAASQNLARLERLAATRNQLEQLRADYEEDEAAIDGLRAASDAIVASFEELMIRRADETGLAKGVLATATAEYRAALAAYEAEQLRKRLAEVARKAGAAAGIPGGQIPGLLCPVDGSTAFINSWGFPRSGGRTHKGTDMFAAKGARLVAVDAGIIKLGNNKLGGITVWLESDHGVAYYYAHLNDYGPGLTSGQRVSKGTVIGYVGNSGNARFGADHLHIQMHPGGRRSSPVNPYPTMVYACG